VFSNRTGWRLAHNRLSAAVERLRHDRLRPPFLDLTGSNPTRAGIPYPSEEIARALAAPEPHRYDPDPRGDREARDAIRDWYVGRGLFADPDRLFLTPGTSESYAWIFKLLCDPDDAVLVPRPSYPLFEFLAGLESVTTASYPLRYEGRWRIDEDALLETLETTRRARAIVVVNPNNPTGSYLSRSERAQLVEIARTRDLAIISDEVFWSFPLERVSSGNQSPLSFLSEDSVPTFVLDGLSKSAGLPGMKAGWIAVDGPEDFRSAALARLEVIADTYLSVGTTVQRALPQLLPLGAVVARSIRARIGANAAALRAAVDSAPSCELLAIEGGWSAVLRVPHKVTEEHLCLQLLELDGVLVQPGWFFDFEGPAYLVVSLLTPEADLAEGIARVLARAA